MRGAEEVERQWIFNRKGNGRCDAEARLVDEGTNDEEGKEKEEEEEEEEERL